MGGKGVFVKEVQAAVLDGRADLAVHSAKDLPVRLDRLGLVIAAVPERGDPRDALVGSTLDDLPPGRDGGHRLGPPPGAAGVAAGRTSPSPSCAATSPPALAKARPSTTPS